MIKLEKKADFILLAVIFALAFAVMGFVEETTIATKFSYFTGEPFQNYELLFLVFTIGMIGSYTFLIKAFLGDFKNRFSLIVFVIHTLFLIATSAYIYYWTFDAKTVVLKRYTDIPFPSEIDLVTRNIRIVLLKDAGNTFLALGGVGILLFILGFYQLKQLRKRA